MPGTPHSPAQLHSSPNYSKICTPKGWTLLSSPELWAVPSLWLRWARQGLPKAGRSQHLYHSSALLWLPTCQGAGDPGQVDTGLKNQLSYKCLPSHLPKSMGCRVRVTGIILLYHQSYCSSCATTQGTHRYLLPQCASSRDSDIQNLWEIETGYLTSPFPGVNTSLIQIIFIFHGDQAMYSSSGTWGRCSSSCSSSGQSSPCSGIVLDVSWSCAGCVQAATHSATGHSACRNKHFTPFPELIKVLQGLVWPWPCSTCNELALQMGTDRFSLHHLIKQTGKGRLFACSNSCFTKYNIHRQTGDKQRMQRWKSPPLGFYLMGSAAHSSLRNQRDICLMTR